MFSDAMAGRARAGGVLAGGVAAGGVMAGVDAITMSRRRLLALGMTTPLAVTLADLLGADAVRAEASVPVGACAFTPIAPTRLADTRPNATTAGFSRLDADTIRVHVAGRQGVAPSVAAAVLNITATNTRGGGYVTVYPAGSARPDASNVNVEYPGQTMPNLVTVQLGVDGAVDIFADANVDLVVDITGAYTPVSGPVAAGRLVVLPAAVRVLDTRKRGVKVAPLHTERVDLAAAVPPGATAAVLNLTVAESSGAGHWTAYPLGTEMAASSNLNTDNSDQTRANQAIISLGEVGDVRGFDVFAAAGGHFIVDVTGYFTGDGAAPGIDGLFVPCPPDRQLDTRRPGSYGRLFAGWTAEFDFVGRPQAQAVVANLTTTQTRGGGHFTAYAARTYRPEASNLNASYAGQTIANHAIVASSTAGVAVFSAGGGHLIADVAGYFTGTPIASYLDAADNPPPPPFVGPALPYVLRAPSIGLVADVIEGVSDAVVNAGYVGHWPGTGMAGETNHVVLFGHRTEHGGIFRYLDRLGPGDEFTLTAQDGRVFRYSYLRRNLTSANALSIFTAAAATPAPSLSLVACSKPDFSPTSTTYRIVVSGVLVG